MPIRLRTTILGLAASLGLAACYNDGYTSTGLSVGYGASYPSYYGWHDGFYYPGTGYYVYDRGGHRQRWNDRQRGYWTERQRTFRGADRAELRQNWRAFRQDRRGDDRAFRQERRQDRQALRAGQISREQYRMNRRADRQASRQELRQDRRELRRENRRDRRDD